MFRLIYWPGFISLSAACTNCAWISIKIVSYLLRFSKNTASFTHLSGSNKLLESAPLLKYATSICAVIDFPNRRGRLQQRNFSSSSFSSSLLIIPVLSTKYFVVENFAYL